MSIRIAAGIVCFNPDIDRLEKNISSIKSQVEQVIIYDNGSNNIGDIADLCSNMILESSDRNMGIAYALNSIMGIAENEGYDYVITLDQDSIAPSDLVKILSELVNDRTAIVCPTIWDINKKENPELVNTYELVDRCITSGSLTSVKSWKTIGGFDERMFIDGVDFDFCDRLRKKNYEIVQSKRIALIHEIGHRTNKRFLFWNISVKNHSAFRKYYIAKNIVYLDRKNQHKGYPIKTLLRECKQVLLVVLYEDDKKSKVRNLIRGMIDGFAEEITR